MAAIAGQPTARPSDLNGPVPTPDINAAAQAFMAKESSQQAVPPQGGSGQDIDAAAQAFMQQQGQQGDEPPQEPTSTTGKVLDAAGRVLDYPGGFMRAGLASAAGLASGQGEVVTPEDLKAAAVGKGPNAAEYLKRLGVSEGGSMNLPGFGRVTVRGAEGLALDIASDPMTVLAKTAKSIPYIGKILNMPGKAADALGEAIYKSAVAGTDAKLAARSGEAGATAVGDALVANGAPVGGLAKLAQKVSDISNTMGNVRQGLYDRFEQLGGKIDMPDDMFKNARGVIDNLRKNPTLRGLADEFEENVNKYQAEGFTSMSDMSKWKTQLYDSLPKGAFNGPALTNPGKMFKAALASDFKRRIISAGEEVEPGLGKAIDELNTKWGPLLEAQPQMAKAAGASTSLGKTIDAATLAAAGPKGFAVKKAFELATSPYAKTLAGKALMTGGRNGIATAVANRGLIDSQQPPAPPDEPQQ